MSFPVELWGLMLQYADFKVLSGEWLLLSSSVSAALDVLWMECAARPSVLVVSDTTHESRRVTKKILLALTRAPVETRNSVSTLSFLSSPPAKLDAKLVRHNLYTIRFWDAVCTLSQLRTIGDDFGQGSYLCSNVIDLSPLQNLTSIGKNFLRTPVTPTQTQRLMDDFGPLPLDPGCAGLVKLPPSVESVGTSFLRGVTVSTVDLSATQIEIASTGFLSLSSSQTVLLPSTLRIIEAHFAIRSPLKVLDLRETSVSCIGKWFLEQSPVEEVHFPTTLTSVGDYFLHRTKVKFCDLEGTRLITIGSYFLGDSPAETVKLPSTLSSIGVFFLAGTNVTALDLQQTILSELPESFCVTKQTISIQLPPTVQQAGTNCFAFPNTSTPFLASKLETRSPAASDSAVLDLRDSALTSIRSCFCVDRPLTAILLPDSLIDIGHQFLNGTQLTKVDLRSTKVTTIGRYFLRNSPVVEVLLPPSLQTMDSYFLQRTMVRHLDLSHTAVVSIGSSLLQGSPVEEVLCPTTLRTIGDQFPACMEAVAANLRGTRVEDETELRLSRERNNDVT
jgi:hypothetical protein